MPNNVFLHSTDTPNWGTAKQPLIPMRNSYNVVGQAEEKRCTDFLK